MLEAEMEQREQEKARKSFFELATRAVHEAQTLVAAKLQADGYVPNAYGYPVSRTGGVLGAKPSVEAYPKNYAHWFEGRGLLSYGQILLEQNEFPKAYALAGFLLDDQKTAGRFGSKEHAESFAKRLAFDLINSIYHSRGTSQEPLSDAEISIPLDKIFRGLTDESLTVDICIPLFGCRFPEELHKLAERAAIVAIPDNFQKAYARFKEHHPLKYVGAPSHALILRGWSLPNGTIWQNIESLSSVHSAVGNAVETGLAALRLGSRVKLGCQHVLFLPQGWRHRVYYDLPELFGSMIEKCPDGISVPVEISGDHLDTIAEIYNKLSDATELRWPVATRRLNASMTRADAQDAIIDATIVLEILLGDDREKDAISYKLRMRGAALAKVAAPPGNVGEVRKRLSDLYATRSSIVHGTISNRKKKQRRVDIEDHSFDVTRDIAIEEVSRIFLTLLRNEKYLDPVLVDMELLLGVARADNQQNNVGEEPL